MACTATRGWLRIQHCDSTSAGGTGRRSFGPAAAGDTIYVCRGTYYEGPTITKLGAPAIHLSMLIPLLIMALACMCYYAAVLLLRARYEILEYERNSAWVSEMVEQRGTGSF